MFDYPVTVHEEAGSVWLSCDDVPEMASAGDTVDEALLDAVEGLESALSLYVDRRQPIPLPSKAKAGQPVVRLPALTAAKVALWNTMLAQDVGKAEMARRLGVNRPQVDRLVDLLHGSKIEAVEHALAILGQRIALTVIAA
ncbi:type II toxin-antitoxin system HicB family antitoxin [Pseudomonas aeruginosa]|uniref:type II toxin-antitoxin system HicB family antitoxin n=1 Tax=Pseudomonas aeruginosa TaxID=287 RepID=UPI00071C0C6D|nr:type II toxin-antitoxin system HicB family antitoxin [Pseudomonas aeruginosa]EKX5765260.1 type II toxin-antitoxin system HicB family antitoxin [Pseudomonas aeruginosa]KSR07177.1 HicB family protein [Pseudomonas aeruginosa]MBH9008080.1 type II toxin-antitoxin system HicB family antitoxin [Pseudomonas aeruginosa]MDG4457133.1 type II toxin-antitoxin system HicB family antitoxin [Pseudomonas aeruginosa]NJC76536.1 type II toxin-antitoxin system HicB family antitoxin [Pseudomonas aeruginosa]